MGVEEGSIPKGKEKWRRVFLPPSRLRRATSL